MAAATMTQADTPVSAQSVHVDFSDRSPDGRAAALEAACASYERHGCFLAKGLFDAQDLAPIRRDIGELIRLRMGKAGLQPQPEADRLSPRFDDGFVQMSRADRANGAAIFDACRRLLPLHALSVDPRLVGIAKALMRSEVIIASDIKAVRVDHPNEDTYLFDYHQDYPYVMDSEDAIVVWMPLHDVDEANGCLSVALGSHKLGLLKVRLNDLRNRSNNKQKFMQIADPSVVERFARVRVPASYGDALVFSTMLLHASGANLSSRARWTAQLRFGNFAHPQAVARDWPGSLRDGSWFDQKHAEYIVNLDEFRQGSDR